MALGLNLQHDGKQRLRRLFHDPSTSGALGSARTFARNTADPKRLSSGTWAIEPEIKGTGVISVDAQCILPLLPAATHRHRASSMPAGKTDRGYNAIRVKPNRPSRPLRAKQRPAGILQRAARVRPRLRRDQ